MTGEVPGVDPGLRSGRHDRIEPVGETTLSTEGITERMDLKRVLRDQVDVIAPDTLVPVASHVG